MTRLERDLEALFEAQTRSLDVGLPPPLGDAEGADRSSGAAVPGPAVVADVDVRTVELGDRVSEPTVANRGPWWSVVTVAAVVALVVSLLVSLVVVSFRDGGERAPAAPPPVTDAPAPVTVPPPPDLVGDATAFWEAVVAGDRAAALGYIGPTWAGPALKVFGRAFTLEGQFDWYEAVDWQWTLDECTTTGFATDEVRCDVTAQNAWSEALGVDPVSGSYYLRFDDDGYLTHITDGFASSARWADPVFEPFSAWVRQHHPDDAEVMFADTDVNAEILDLYEINTERFVAAQLAERSTTTTPTQAEP